MDVVAAGVHDALALAGVGDAGLFLDREGVHVAAHQYPRPAAVFHHRHHPIATILFFTIVSKGIGDLVAQLLQARGHQLRGLLLLHRQLRRGVELFVRGQKRRHLAIDELIDCSRRGLPG